LSISGTVYIDNNLDGNVNGTPVNIGVTSPSLCMNLIDPIVGVVVATAFVDSNGTYNFSNVTANTVYDIVLKPNCGLVGSPPTTGLNAPSGWNNTGEDCCDGLGDDGIPEGVLSIAVTDSSIANANFGIQNIFLPINMTDFNVSEYNCQTIVAWSTAMEENISHFEVQRKEIGKTDFITLAALAAKGNTTEGEAYTYTDKSNQENERYYLYRIKTVDNDLSVVYSEFRSIKINCAAKEVPIRLYPNPAIDNLNLLYTNEEALEQLRIDVVDLSGRIVKSNIYKLNNGINLVKMDVSNLAKGHYYTRYLTDQGLQLNTPFSKE